MKSNQESQEKLLEDIFIPCIFKPLSSLFVAIQMNTLELYLQLLPDPFTHHGCAQSGWNTKDIFIKRRVYFRSLRLLKINSF